MPLGDLVKKILSPFVANTRFVNCEACEKRRVKLNNFSTWVSDFFSTITCPCFWRKLFRRK